MYEIEIVDDGGLKRLIKKFEDDVAFNRMLYTTMLKAVQHVRTQVIASGRVPFLTGTLRRGITTNVSGGNAREIEGQVGTPAEIKYAALQEFGGTFTRTQAFGRPTRAYTVTYRGHHYLGKTMEERKEFVQGMFNDAIEAYMAKV